MAKTKAKCRFGRLKSPVRIPGTGSIRRCKLKKKTKKGRAADRALKSQEAHEVRYRRSKRKTTRRKAKKR